MLLYRTISDELSSSRVFDFPSCPAGLGESDERLFGDRMIGDPGIVIEDLARGLIGHGEFEPVRQQGVVRIAEREIGHEAEGPALPDDLGDPLAFGLPLALFEEDAMGSDPSCADEVVDPLGGRGMGRRLAGEEKTESGGRRLLAEGLMGIEVVSQKGDPQRS